MTRKSNKTRSTAREIFDDFMKVIRFFFYLFGALIVFLFAYQSLPAGCQNKLMDRVTAIFGEYTVTTTEIFSEVEEFQKEPKFILGYQYINDSIVIKTKKPFCDPAFDKTIFRRKASYVYDITSGSIDITFTTDTMYFRREPSISSTYCNYSAPQLSVQKLQVLQDSMLIEHKIQSGKTEGELRDIVQEFVKLDHLKWKTSVNP